MSHFFSVALDHGLQFFDISRRDLSLHKAVQTVNNRQHSDNKIETDIHNAAIVTQLGGEPYKVSDAIRLPSDSQNAGFKA